MNFLKMFIKELLEKKMPINIKKLVGQLPLEVQKLLLIVSYAPWKH